MRGQIFARPQGSNFKCSAPTIHPYLHKFVAVAPIATSAAQIWLHIEVQTRESVYLVAAMVAELIWLCMGTCR